MASSITRPGRDSQRAEMLAWAASLGAVTPEAVSRHDGCTISSARGRLAAAERAGLLAAHRLLRGEPALYTVTRSGMRAAAVADLEPARVSPGGARHAIACCTVAPELEHAFPDHLLLGEPALRREERRSGAPLASIRLGPGAGRWSSDHRPDLVLLERAGRGSAPVAVEVELTVKAPERLRAICRGWARSRRVAGVLYLVAPEVRAPLLRAIEAAGGCDRIVPVDLDALSHPEEPTPELHRTVAGAP